MNKIFYPLLFIFPLITGCLTPASHDSYFFDSEVSDVRIKKFPVKNPERTVSLVIDNRTAGTQVRIGDTANDTGNVVIHASQSDGEDDAEVSVRQRGRNILITIQACGALSAPAKVKILLPEELKVVSLRNRGRTGSFEVRLRGRRLTEFFLRSESGIVSAEFDGCRLDSVILGSNYGKSVLVMRGCKAASIQLNAATEPAKIDYWDWTAGLCHLHLYDTEISGKLGINGVSGKIEFFADNCRFEEVIRIESVNGAQYYDFWDSVFEGDAALIGVSETGKIELRWSRHDSAGADTAITLATNSDILLCRYFVPYEIGRHTVFESGDPGRFYIDAEPDFAATGNAGEWISHNFDEPIDLYRTELTNTGGSVELRVTDCYKLRRYCGDYHPDAVDNYTGFADQQ